MGTTSNVRRRLLAGTELAERELSLAGNGTIVLEAGDGPPMVLLHGPGEFAGTWLPVLRDLRRTHRVIVPDLPGHGTSDLPNAPLTVEVVLQWLEELIDQTCGSPPVLVGRVLGGAIAARFAASRPERLGVLVLVDTLGLSPFGPAPRFALAMHRFLAEPNTDTYRRFMDFCAFDLDRASAGLGERWSAYAEYAVELARRPGAHESMGELIDIFGATEIPADVLARIGVPTTLIWGREDLATPLKIAESASIRFGWPLRVIDDAGDDPGLDRPAEFVRVVQEAVRLSARVAS
jgi:pimeloyl-ACP methyl ester carboxylesterase